MDYCVLTDMSDDEDEAPPPVRENPEASSSTDGRAEAIATLEQLRQEFMAKKKPPFAQRQAEFDAKQRLLLDGTDAEAKAQVFKVLTIVGWWAKNACYRLTVVPNKDKGETFTASAVLAYTFADAVRVADAGGTEEGVDEGVERDVAVARRFDAARVIDLDATQPDRALVGEAMDVHAKANPHSVIPLNSWRSSR